MKNTQIVEAGERTHQYEQPEHGILCAICGNGINDPQHGRTQHTPGPWRAQESARGFQINANGHEPGNSTVVATIYETAVFANEPDHASADAHLIAAAPELLEALKNAATWFACIKPDAHDTGNVLNMKERARAAIAKAEGRAA